MPTTRIIFDEEAELNLSDASPIDGTFVIPELKLSAQERMILFRLVEIPLREISVSHFDQDAATTLFKKIHGYAC